jgi:hypothetical protein
MFREYELTDELEANKQSILAEANATEELNDMADMLEAKDIEQEHSELITLARHASRTNPISEAAYDIKENLMTALKEAR